MTPEQQGRSTSWPGIGQLLTITRRSEAVAGLTIGLMLAVVATLVALAPTLLRQAESDSLERAIADAPLLQQRLAVRTLEGFGSGTRVDPTAEHRAVVDEAASVIPESVSSTFGEPRIVIDSPRLVLGSVNSTPTVSPTTLTLRVHPELDEHSRLVAGRAAQPGVEIVDGLSVMEFELSTVAADVLGLELGDVLEVAPDTADPVTQRYDGGIPEPFGLRLVGTRELDPAADPYWFGDARLHRPVVSDTNAGANFTVFGSIPAAALPERPFQNDGRGPLIVEQRRDLVASRVSIDDADELLADLDALAASSVSTPTPGEPAIFTGFGVVLDAERAERSVARSSVVLAAVGMLGVALVTLVLCLQVALHRRRSWLTIARSRGVAPRQVVLSGALEMSVVAGVAVAIGALVARVVAASTGVDDGAAWGTAAPWLIALWIGAIATTVWTLIVDVRRPIGAGDRATRDRAVGRAGRVAAILLVVLTVAALFTFLRRGVAVDGDGIDTLAVLLPVMLPLSAGLAAGWALPALLGPLARGGMSLGPGRLIGTRRAMVRGGAGPGLVAVLTMAVALAGLGLGVSRSLEAGITDASWTAVGAPFRIDTTEGTVEESIAAIDGVELATLRGAPINIEHDGQRLGARLLTIDAATITELTEGTAADPSLPTALGTAREDGRVPIVASSRLDDRLVRPGDVIATSSSADVVEFVVLDTRDEMFGRDTDWIVADSAVLGESMDQATQISALFFDVPESERAMLDSIVVRSELELEDRGATSSRLRGDPLVLLVHRAYVVAALVAVALALTAVGALSVLTSRQRRREVGLLRLLGAGRGETGRAIRSELVPPCAIGIVLGSLIGWWLSNAFDGRFELSAFASGADVVVRPDLSVLLLVGVLAGAAIWSILAMLQRRADRVPSADVLSDQGDR